MSEVKFPDKMSELKRFVVEKSRGEKAFFPLFLFSFSSIPFPLFLPPCLLLLSRPSLILPTLSYSSQRREISLLLPSESKGDGKTKGEGGNMEGKGRQEEEGDDDDGATGK